MSQRLKLSIFLLLFAILSSSADESKDIPNEEPHPDPNEEDYAGMAYIGRIDDDGRRVGFDLDNGELLVLNLEDASLALRCTDTNCLVHHQHMNNKNARNQIHIRNIVR